jgi:hypothetical protein
MVMRNQKKNELKNVKELKKPCSGFNKDWGI